MANYLLQENGYKILQENGFGILLESSLTIGNKIFTIDGLVKKQENIEFTTDGIVKRVNSSLMTISGLIKITSNKAITVSGIIIRINNDTFTIDGIIYSQQHLSFTIDGEVGLPSKSGAGKNLEAQGGLYNPKDMPRPFHDRSPILHDTDERNKEKLNLVGSERRIDYWEGIKR